jgi:hypothetical protein
MRQKSFLRLLSNTQKYFKRTLIFAQTQHARNIFSGTLSIVPKVYKCTLRSTQKILRTLRHALKRQKGEYQPQNVK